MRRRPQSQPTHPTQTAGTRARTILSKPIKLKAWLAIGGAVVCLFVSIGAMPRCGGSTIHPNEGSEP